MKKLLSLFVLLPVMVVGQTQTENYIRSKTYKVATTTSIASPSAIQALQNVTYFDGLGRPIQQIAHQQSGSGKDIVTPIEYDAFGRQPKEYLPYVPNATASLDYKASALTDVFNFTPYTGQNPFSQKQLEASPLNRVFKQAAPGADWALNTGHEIKLDYQTNTTADAVKLFSVTANWDLYKGLYNIPTSLTPADYLDFQLYKTITYNENTAATPSESNGSTVEFKNKEGQVVLKRTYESSVKHDTYYVYDQYGNLTFVIPPLVDTTTSISNTILDDLCYQYKYDYRNRLVEKKLPGKQWEFIVYDKLDRVVATGPAFPPFSDLTTAGWLITKYDTFSRVAYTGWENSTATSSTRTSKQYDQNGLTTSLNEVKSAPGIIDGVSTFYTNSVAPTVLKILTVNYYDDYNFSNAPSFPAYSYNGVSSFYNNTTMKPKGMPTGSWVRVVTTTSSTVGETNYVLYDYKARPIRNYNTNYLGGYTRTDIDLDFSGKTTHTYTTHKRVSTDTQILTQEYFTYSPQDRLLTHTHQVNSLPVQLLASNTYDELGQLISKNVGNTTAAQLQKVDYGYNIRGWLTSINNDPTNNLVLNTTENDLFAFKINYNTTEGNVASVKSLYNGNISETYYRTGSDNVLRKYGYQYDNLNRLKNAIYQKPGGNTYPTYEDFSEKNITYDKNGNIQTLSRNGDVIDALPANQIDNLYYTYKANSNVLTSVYDNSGNTSGFKDSNIGADDYSYDANGNMTVDKNKNITSIKYNHLNLPTSISLSNGNISYIYNALGQKVEKTVIGYLTSDFDKTYYIGGFQYKDRINNSPNSKLQFITTSEGYYDYINTKYVFNYTDHLGNVRLSYAKNPTTNVLEIIEESNYYPFGLKHKNYNSNNYQPEYKYKYNGKELQDELGLNVYDYGAMMYDPALGRRNNIDPLAELSRRWSPYSYCYNNPIFFVDPDGMYPYPITTRSFAPFSTFGGGFSGDSRGFSTNAGATSRLSHSYVMNTDNHTYTNNGATSSPSHHPLLRSGQATNDVGTISNAKYTTNKDGSTTTSWTSTMSGKNPLTERIGIPTPAIDVKTNFSLTENKSAGTLGVNVTQTGDAFPSAETMIGDTKGNQLMIGVSPAVGNPFTSLPGEGDKQMMSSSFTVTMDNNGVFTGIQQGDKTYSVGDWNKMMTSTPAVKSNSISQEKLNNMMDSGHRE